MIGPYQIQKTIAKGGMGEVLLGFDPICKRSIAIKRIREEYQTNHKLRKRFLKEAHVTASLTHPGIISIYTINEENKDLYYTMPYVEGQTLKQIIIEGIKDKTKWPIAALLTIFKTVCQTIAYAHSKRIIHRDIKPENILVGKFGEVIILDWGLAISDQEVEDEYDLEITNQEKHLTQPGKIVGTLAYLAPERIKKDANALTDIYSLGVILYQLLTLRLPFKRNSLKEFQKKKNYEKLVDPEEMAPYRDVPPRLSAIVKKCLATSPEERYHNVEGLIYDLEGHMEGRAEWYEIALLDIHKKEDWEFQENLFVAKHMAISRSLEGAEWISIMLSKTSFAENLKIGFNLKIDENGQGIGILLNVPENSERKEPIEGYCLWLASDLNLASQLFRNTAQVMNLPELVLKRGKIYQVTIEKRDHHIICAINGAIQFTYISYLPLVGTHIGILSRDADFSLSPIQVFIGSHALQVSCLAIPDAFLAVKEYRRALAGYRRIGYSFPGHAEGREALFRAGITLLEQGKNTIDQEKKEEFFHLALNEFTLLQKTPGAPLEYLGKSLVYAESKDPVSEIKCLELGLRRFPNHPLILAIKEQILFRLHETAKKSRPSAYRLILLALYHLKEEIKTEEFQRLFKSLVTHWEKLSFFSQTESLKMDALIILSFWLAEPFYLLEIFQKLDPKKDSSALSLGNLLYALFELNEKTKAEQLFQTLEKQQRSFKVQEILTLLRPIIIGEENLEIGFKAFFALKSPEIGQVEFRTLRFLLERTLFEDREELIELAWQKTQRYTLAHEIKTEFDAYRIWAFLKEDRWEKAGEVFSTYPLEMLNQEKTPLYPLFGCYLLATEGPEIAHVFFSGVSETPFPRSSALLAHEVNGKLTNWFAQSFLWERRLLYRFLSLYYHVAEDPEKETYYRSLDLLHN